MDAQRLTVTREAERRAWQDVLWVEDAGVSAKPLQRQGAAIRLDALGPGRGGRLDRRQARSVVTIGCLLSVITAGIWLIVWANLVATDRPQRIVLSVSDQGVVERTVTTASKGVSRR